MEMALHFGELQNDFVLLLLGPEWSVLDPNKVIYITLIPPYSSMYNIAHA
jgi:hypothetical protein